MSIFGEVGCTPVCTAPLGSQMVAERGFIQALPEVEILKKDF
jgi:hypothetical protein